jgi:HEAT repeat protein
VDSVIELLASDDPAERAEGIRCAPSCSAPEVATRLAELVRNDAIADAQRQAAAEALGAISLPAAHEALYSLLSDENARLRGFAALGLANVATERSV